MTTPTNEPRGPEFERATAKVDRLLSKPEVAADVAAGRKARAEMNRAYTMNLAMIRQAADLTQAELADLLGTDQGSVSKLEKRQDMLLSTLASYLRATGADTVSIVVSVHGTEYALDLTGLNAREAEAV
jgi:DNA-binding XRE family transcriptional regulator